eukprot:2439882-Amphidinium_carterae.1
MCLRSASKEAEAACSGQDSKCFIIDLAAPSTSRVRNARASPRAIPYLRTSPSNSLRALCWSIGRAARPSAPTTAFAANTAANTLAPRDVVTFPNLTA